MGTLEKYKWIAHQKLRHLWIGEGVFACTLSKPFLHWILTDIKKKFELEISLRQQNVNKNNRELDQNKRKGDKQDPRNYFYLRIASSVKINPCLR